jgi:hypothetical protein
MTGQLSVTRRWLAGGAGVAILAAGGFVWFSGATASPAIEVFKSATCDCCAAWVKHIQDQGFRTKVVVLDDDSLAAKKRSLGVPDALTSCHTSILGAYVLEGHVPASAIRRLLTEQPSALGLAVPGMPLGSPGMEVPGQPNDPYDVLLVGKDGATQVFERVTGAT